MGANWVTINYHGNKQEVADRFKKDQEQDLYENGHSYSGGIGMASGLIFMDKCFDNTHDAEEYLITAAQKWQEALAVHIKGTHTWVVGAWCSS